MESKVFTFDKLPESLPEFERLMGDRKDPFKIATLYIVALSVYVKDRDSSLRMIDALKGPEVLSHYERFFIRDTLSDSIYLPFSYYKGATPENGYRPLLPLTIEAFETEDSDRLLNEGFKSIFFKSSGSEIMRSIKVRCVDSTDEWYYWQQFILDSIRKPKNLGKWA